MELPDPDLSLSRNCCRAILGDLVVRSLRDPARLYVLGFLIAEGILESDRVLDSLAGEFSFRLHQAVELAEQARDRDKERA